MARPLSYLFVSICVIYEVIAEKESNILKLSRPQKITSNETKTTNFNVTEYTEKNESGKQSPLIAFSKNNPELDWKNYLKMFDGNEEEHRDLDVDFMKEKLEKTANSIQWLADLYDPLRWARVPGKLQDECRRDMEKFLSALRNGKLWAAKMSDASGRYSSQFHFGNGFWLGSITLCRELNITDRKTIMNIEEQPPFLLRFHVARFYLNLPKEVDFSIQSYDTYTACRGGPQI